jgi:hypothetical protein
MNRETQDRISMKNCLFASFQDRDNISLNDREKFEAEMPSLSTVLKTDCATEYYYDKV